MLEYYRPTGITAEEHRREAYVNARPGNYISFLLRLYRVRGQEGWSWRVSLEDPLTGERRTFPDLQALFDFLEACIGTQVEDDQENE